jgi:hypothetical protein
MRGSYCWGLALVLAVGTARGQEPRGRLVEDLWNAAWLGGGKAGFVHTTIREIERDGQKLLRATTELNLKLKRFDAMIEVRMEAGTEETPDGKVVGVFSRQSLGKNQQMVLTGSVQDNELHVLVDGGNRQKKAVPWNPEVVGQARQERHFQERQVKPGDQFSFLSYEPVIVAVVTWRVRVKDFEEVEVLGKKQKLLRVESVADKIQGVQLPPLVSWLDDKYRVVRSQTEIPELGQLTLYRTTREKALANGGPLAQASTANIGMSSLLPINRRIPNPYLAKSVVYRITLKDDDDPASAFVQDGRQQIKNLDGRTFNLHVRAVPLPKTGTPEGQVGEEYLKSSYFLKCDDARVQDHARKAINGATDAWEKARRVEKWVYEHVDRTKFDEAFATADEAARTLKGDCSENAMLAAAMCRAVGVPSKVAVGLIYVDGPKGPVMGFHMWAEVWVRGQWVPIDGTLGRSFVGASHLKITDHSWHDTQSLTPLLPVLRVLGKLRIEVVEVNGKD